MRDPQMTLDTLSCLKRLEAAGFERKQAEAIATTMRDDVAPQMATRSDLKEAVADMKQEMWKQSISILLGGLLIGGFLIRFLK